MSSNQLQGILSVLGVVFLWTASSFATSAILVSHSFHKPFLVTYLNTASFVLYLIAYLRFKKPEKPVASSHEGVPLLATSSTPDCPGPEGRLDFKQTAQISLYFCLLWFAANWSINAALGLTTVASSTILSSTSGIFTLAIGVVFGTDRISLKRAIAAFLTVAGTYFITNAETSTAMEEESAYAMFFGNCLALFSAFVYGCYSTLLKKAIQDESRVDMMLFFGWVGVWNVLTMWPGFFVLHWTGVEPFELPQDLRVWAIIVLNALLGTCLSDYLWLKAVLLTSPLMVTIGLSLSIPLALLGDIVFKQVEILFEYWIGTMMVIVGFILVNLSETPSPPAPLISESEVNQAEELVSPLPNVKQLEEPATDNENDQLASSFVLISDSEVAGGTGCRIRKNAASSANEVARDNEI